MAAQTQLTLNTKVIETENGYVRQYGPKLFGSDDFQVRDKTVKDAVNRYSEVLDKLPNVRFWLDKKTGMFWLVDGHQRTEAHIVAYNREVAAYKKEHPAVDNAQVEKKFSGLLTITGEYDAEQTKDKAQVEAAISNLTHGQPLTLDERETVVLRLAETLGQAVRKIAEMVSMSPGTVTRIFQKEKLRQEISKYCRANNRQSFAREKEIGSAILWEVLNLQGTATGRTNAERGVLRNVDMMCELAEVAYDKKLSSGQVRRAVELVRKQDNPCWTNGPKGPEGPKRFQHDRWISTVRNIEKSAPVADINDVVVKVLALIETKPDDSFKAKAHSRDELRQAEQALASLAKWTVNAQKAVKSRLAAAVKADAKPGKTLAAVDPLTAPTVTSIDDANKQASQGVQGAASVA